MTEFLRIISALQQQMNATFSRSDVLRPLHIMLGTMVFLVLGLAYAGDKVPGWALGIAIGGLGLTIALELGAYLYCLIYDPDALRSERFQLQKMAIEARLLGDETAGLFEVTDVTPKKAGGGPHQSDLAPPPIALEPPTKKRSRRARNESDDV